MQDSSFLNLYGEAALTSIGYFWQALWAFILGYVVSSAIQVFVTKERMKNIMGDGGKSSIAIGTFFGFISSSCSFAALSTTKSLFKKGAGFVPAIAFLLASTNLVIELGIIIAIFLGWQFVAGEYIGGILLILFSWLIFRITHPSDLVRSARRRVRENKGEDDDENESTSDWQQKIKSMEGWRQVAKKYFMEWGMVWKDVTVGFTIAGIIAVFVPASVFQTLFISAGAQGSPSFWAVLENVIVGPIAAFFTFIGSMGNIPLATILYNNGVSFGGVMAFIFSDLVVFPVIRVNAKYYGWKMALYILGLLFASLIATSLLLHYGFSLLGILPQDTGSSSSTSSRFAIDYTFFLNLAFLIVTGVLAWLKFSGKEKKDDMHSHGSDKSSSDKSIIEKVLFWLAIASYVWLAGGLLASFV